MASNGVSRAGIKIAGCSVRREDAAKEETEDNDRYQPSVGLNYWFGPKFGIETRGVYTRGEFDQDSDFTGTPTDDFDNWVGSIRLLQRLGRHFDLYQQYVQTYRNYDGDADDDYLVYAPSAGFIYRIEKDLTFSLGAGYFYQEIDGDDDEQGLFGSGQVNKIWNFRRGSIDPDVFNIDIIRSVISPARVPPGIKAIKPSCRSLAIKSFF